MCKRSQRNDLRDAVSSGWRHKLSIQIKSESVELCKPSLNRELRKSRLLQEEDSLSEHHSETERGLIHTCLC